MPPNVIFLGWSEPWTQLFARWLAREPELLRRRLVVVPTRESGRRLREALANSVSTNGCGAILGPRVATSDDFFRPEQTMPDAVRWAGWLAVLRETSDTDLEALFPAGISEKDDAWRLSVVRQIEQARELLISAGCDFEHVAKNLAEEADRWHQLAELKRRVEKIWRKWGFDDPVEAKKIRAQEALCPQGVDEIILAGITDPTLLALTAWQHLQSKGVRFTVLTGAPEAMRHAFDDWGKPKSEYWSDREKHTTPLPDKMLVAADPVALADAVVQTCLGKNNDEVAVGVCCNTFMPAVTRGFEAAGWSTFAPEGNPLSQDGWPELLDALADAVATPADYASIARVARHPVVWSQWLEYGSKITFAKLDKWERNNATCDANLGITKLRDSEYDEFKAAGELLAKIHELVQASAGRNGGNLVKQLLKWMRAEEDVLEKAECETACWPRLEDENFNLSLRLRWLAASLSSMKQSPDRNDAALALQGWLELSFDPALHLVLSGLHEGSVPEAPAADPLITEALRERLGLRDRKSRLARESFLYTAMVEGRRSGGSVTVITAQVDAQGEPCNPSRVLLQAVPKELPARVLKLVKEKPDVRLPHTPPWARANWKLVRPDGVKPNKEWKHMSPSTLSAYLKCPTRFYFERVLGWSEFAPLEDELDGGQFGDLVHSVLRDWGNDVEAREFSDAEKLRTFWDSLLNKQTGSRFGSKIPSLIRLQVMSAKERLFALAEKQAEQRKAGWHVVAVEKELNGIITLGGLPVHMKVDRIDRREDGALRVIDYKTGKMAVAPKKTHLRTWSAEKCPPPMGPLCIVRGSGRSRDREYAWSDLQLPLYAAAVQRQYESEKLPETFYALMPAGVGETKFEAFENLPEIIENALCWAGEAAQRIIAGVFWPPVPDVSFDSLGTLAPEGLAAALGEEWASFLHGNPLDEQTPSA